MSLPETPDFDTIDRAKLPFPCPLRVIETSEDKLREIGLSYPKARYVKDIARRFADGRLDIRKIMHMDAETCVETLTQAKGIGRWTAEMLLMFALRRPDIIPVGDLGVQRGMVFFYTSGRDGPAIRERKKVKTEEAAEAAEAGAALEPAPVLPEADPLDPLPLPPAAVTSLSTLRSRASGCKTKKGMYLDTHEMEALASPWAPYRSVASMFMWGIIGS